MTCHDTAGAMTVSFVSFATGDTVAAVSAVTFRHGSGLLNCVPLVRREVPNGPCHRVDDPQVGVGHARVDAPS